jgi:hypothetical protein
MGQIHFFPLYREQAPLEGRGRVDREQLMAVVGDRALSIQVERLGVLVQSA